MPGRDVVAPRFAVGPAHGPQAAVERLPTSLTAFVGTTLDGPSGDPVAVAGMTDFRAVFGYPSAAHPLGHLLSLYFLNGGADAVVVRRESGEETVDWAGALGDVSFNLLVLPGVTAEDVEQVRAVLSVCAERGALLLLDPPAEAAYGQGTDAAAELEALRDHGSHAALFYPWLRVEVGGADGDVELDLPPSGAVAGVIARCDRQDGVWKAPAGQEAGLRGVSGLARTVPGPAHDELNRQGVNLLRLFTGPVPVVWGSRTLAPTGDAEFRYLSVRRLVDHVVASLRHGLAFASQWPNDVTLWAELRRLSDDFLHGLARRGALQGVKPGEAWFVRCDRSTTTQADLDNGRVVVEIGLAPMRPAEFVVVRIVLDAGPATAEADRGTLVVTGSRAERLGRAEAIARDRGVDVLRVDLEQVVSKYIGETEKNLARVFDQAERSGAVLLFDEADALFGKRTEIRDSHDRYANVEVGYLLQRAERHTGLVVLGVDDRAGLTPEALRRLTGQPDSPQASARRRKDRRRSSGS